MQPGSKLWIGVAACLTLGQTVASLLIPRGYALTAVSDVISALLILSLVVAFVRNALSTQGRLRSVCILQATCWSFWLLDQLGWMFYDILLRKPMPEMFSGDVVLFLAGVPMLAGLLLRPHVQPSRGSVRLGILDFFQLMLWWIFFYVYLVMCWQYVSPNAFLYNRNFDRLYLLEVVVLITVVSLLVKQSAGAWRRYYAYFLGAVTFNCLMVVVENRAIELGKYYNGSWYDTPFVGSFAVFMLVAIRGRDLAPSPEAAGDRKYASWMASLAVLAILSLPIIMAVAVMDKSASPEVAHFRILLTAAAMFVMAALVFVKQQRLHEELRQTNQILAEASMTDPLTRIRNRRYFSETIEGDVAQSIRAYTVGHERNVRDLVFYLIDLDNFKEVNDLHGHDAGDRVLVETAQRIGSVVRDSDVLLRWGGEEFLILSRFTDRREADALAVRVMQAVRGEPFAVSPQHQIRRTCSVGWAAFPWREDNIGEMSYEEVLNMADRALSQAKRAGKDQAIGMTPSQNGLDLPVNFLRSADQSSSGTAWRSDPADLQPAVRTRP